LPADRLLSVAEVMGLVELAERQLNESLFKAWHRVRTDPGSVRAERQGVEAMKMRLIALLTGSE
jgi:hypothetical protein